MAATQLRSLKADSEADGDERFKGMYFGEVSMETDAELAYRQRFLEPPALAVFDSAYSQISKNYTGERDDAGTAYIYYCPYHINNSV